MMTGGIEATNAARAISATARIASQIPYGPAAAGRVTVDRGSAGVRKSTLDGSHWGGHG